MRPLHREERHDVPEIVDVRRLNRRSWIDGDRMLERVLMRKHSGREPRDVVRDRYALAIGIAGGVRDVVHDGRRVS